MTKEKEDHEGGSGARMLTLLLVGAAVIAALYLVFGREKSSAAPPAPTQAPAPELPCLDERCAERAEHLKCVEWANGAPSVCSMWRVLYETRCTCLERGTPKPDGGVP